MGGEFISHLTSVRCPQGDELSKPVLNFLGKPASTTHAPSPQAASTPGKHAGQFVAAGQSSIS
jgi:hypothetical protein